MARLTNLSFEEWVEFSFARPREKDVFKRDYLDDPPETMLAYITRAFVNAEMVFALIPDKQLAGAFWNIGMQLSVIHDSPSSKYCKLCLPGTDRARAIRSILTLFTEVFANRCDDHLCHLDHGEGDNKDPRPLNGICYMWWDGTCQSGAFEDDPCRDEIDSAILDVLEGTLALKSIACQESALHGLGHAISWHDFPLHEDRDDVTNWDETPWIHRSEATRRARSIIDAYLMWTPPPPPNLVEYAQTAWFGCVQ